MGVRRASMLGLMLAVCGGGLQGPAFTDAAFAQVALAQVSVAQGGSIVAGRFDGPWAIDVRTASGPCGTGFAGEYSIVQGRIVGRFTSAGRVQEVTGTVEPDGSLLMRIGGEGGIVLSGQLQWRVGWGEWESPDCAGTFMTNRR
jgi:hypothetical protein